MSLNFSPYMTKRPNFDGEKSIYYFSEDMWDVLEFKNWFGKKLSFVILCPVYLALLCPIIEVSGLSIFQFVYKIIAAREKFRGIPSRLFWIHFSKLQMLISLFFKTYFHLDNPIFLWVCTFVHMQYAMQFFSKEI